MGEGPRRRGTVLARGRTAAMECLVAVGMLLLIGAFFGTLFDALGSIYDFLLDLVPYIVVIGIIIYLVTAVLD
jgi:hypothetical protein